MSADGGGTPPPPLPEDFEPEAFCDEVYDYVDDSVAEEMTNMEKELNEAAGIAGNRGPGVNKKITTVCDKVQKRIQTHYDRNVDIFDAYTKKYAPTKMAPAPAPAAGAGANNGAAPAAGGWSAGAGGAGYSGASAAKGGADAWVFEVDEAAPPKSLQEEEALDAELDQLRKRRRKGLTRCVAMVRKDAQVNALLMDTKDFVAALELGITSSFHDNGLMPLPSKVQEAVQSCAELKATAARAQELIQRLEREHAIDSAAPAAGGGGGGSSSSGAVASTVPPPRDLHAMFQRSSEQQVIAGGASEYPQLEKRLRR